MTESSDPATARKRRKEIMQSLRAGDTGENAAAGEKEPSQEEALPPKKRKVQARKKKAPAKDSKAEGEATPKNGTAKSTENTTEEKNGKKTQIRYDPDVPMSKEQLAAWRREARRVRNRESAAASRQRIRDRINELEDEVGQWKAKYDQAMARLQQVEQVASSQQSH